MASLNKVILIGHLTADPELKQTPNGVAVVSFSIGVTRRFTRSGEQPQSDFINIVAWRQTAEFISRFFKKGRAICICGSLQTRSWTDQQGNKRYATEVVADEASFVDSKPDGVSGNIGSTGASSVSGGYTPPFATDSSESVGFEEMQSDDDLPF